MFFQDGRWCEISQAFLALCEVVWEKADLPQIFYQWTTLGVSLKYRKKYKNK